MTDTTKQNIHSQGGQALSQTQDMSKKGQKGGHAAQQSGHANTLTDAERSMGGQNSPTNFANRPTDEVEEIASKGGMASHDEDKKDE